MNKEDIRNRINAGFSEVAPDVFDSVVESLQTDTSEAEICNMMKKAERKSVKRIISACATLAAACMTILFVAGMRNENIYVVMDVNPSVEIVMDRTYAVKKIYGLNKEGNQIVEELKVHENESVKELLYDLFESMEKKGYLQRGSGMLFAVSTPQEDEGERLVEELDGCVREAVEQMELADVVMAFCITEKQNVRMGRKVLEKQLGVKTGADAEQMAKMSLGEFLTECSSQGVGNVQLIQNREKVEEDLNSTEKTTYKKGKKISKKEQADSAGVSQKDETVNVKKEKKKQEEQKPVTEDPKPPRTEEKPEENTQDTGSQNQQIVQQNENAASENVTPQTNGENIPSGEESKKKESSEKDNSSGKNGKSGDNGKGNNGNGNGNNSGYESSGNENAGSKENSSDENSNGKDNSKKNENNGNSNKKKKD